MGKLVLNTITVSMPKALIEKLESTKWRLKMTRSKIVQEAVKEYLEKKEPTKK